MAKIISFANQKGGTGKTQCTVLTASALSRSKKTLVLDMDDQQSITIARQFDTPDKNSFDIEPVTINTLYGVLKDHYGNYDFIFIDLPGKLDINKPAKDQTISQALMYIDYLFIPFVAGNYNLESTLSFINVVQQIQAVKDEPTIIHGFINMYRSRSRLNDYLIEDIKVISNKTNIPFLKAPLKNYTLYAETDTVTSIYDTKSKEPAKVNFKKWFNEVKKIINQ